MLMFVKATLEIEDNIKAQILAYLHRSIAKVFKANKINYVFKSFWDEFLNYFQVFL